MSEPQLSNPSKSLQILKQRVARALRGKRRNRSLQLRLPFRNGAWLPVFWQRRFYDFNVWSAKKFREKLDYMHRNPVERKLVTHPKDWPWSSWSFYEQGEEGLIRMDVLKPKTETSKSAPFAKTAKSAAPDIAAVLR
jgi:hypothetical protein